MKTLIPVPALPGQDPLPRFKVAIPKNITPDPKHFPSEFPADYPATVTDFFARDILALNESVNGTFHVYINFPEFLHNEYSWLPFTLAMHALILAPQCNVFFCGMGPMEYSRLADAERGSRKPLYSIQNFVTYLRTKDRERPRRVFEQLSTGTFVSFEYRIMNEFRAFGFSQYYERWMQYPFEIRTHSGIVYYTHPFDHLPVKNLTWSLQMGYMTGPQRKTQRLAVPDIGSAVLLHDQMRTVALRPYWGSV